MASRKQPQRDLKEIYIKSATGNLFVVLGSRDDSIKTIKEKIFSFMGYPVESQTLFYNGRLLSDDMTVGSVNIDEKRFIDLKESQPMTNQSPTAQDPPTARPTLKETLGKISKTGLEYERVVAEIMNVGHYTLQEVENSLKRNSYDVARTMEELHLVFPQDRRPDINKQQSTKEPDILAKIIELVETGENVDVEKLIKVLKSCGLFGGGGINERSVEIIGALVKSLCSKIFDFDDDDEVDMDEFDRCSKVFVRIVATKPQLEMKVLDTLADFCHGKDRPKGLFVKLLTILKERQGISLETFRKWWQMREDTLPAMMRSNGEVKAFFSRITVITTSEAGSESDQGE